jgi:hypothetical protein
VADWEGEAAGGPASLASTRVGPVEVGGGAAFGLSSDSMMIRMSVSS